MTRGRIRRVGALALLVALATTACAGGVASPEPARTPEPTTPASPLADTRWEVADLDGAPPAADSTLTAAFGADGVSREAFAVVDVPDDDLFVFQDVGRFRNG